MPYSPLLSPLRALEMLNEADTLRRSNLPEAAALCLVILTEFPSHPPTLYLLGMIRLEQDRLEEGADLLSQAATLAPTMADYHLALARILHRQGRPIPALERLHTAFRLDPNNATTCFMAGDLAMDLGRPNAAAVWLEQGVTLDPEHRGAWLNLGLCHKAMGQAYQAQKCWDRLLARNPADVEAHVNRALLWLTNGLFAQGWREYEWRLQTPDLARLLARIPPTLPRWPGNPLAGARILVVAEQGFGDTLQFIRYLPMVRQAGGEILLTAPRPLLSLLRRQGLADEVIPWDEMTQAATCRWWIPLVSLPGIFATSAANIPTTTPYITADPALTGLWQERLGRSTSRIGLVWSGKPLHLQDPCRQRSCPPAALQPLAQVANVVWYSLQTPAPEEPPPGLAMAMLGGELGDFEETAAIMANLDQVVTIDTAAAHLAGAMGKPVKLLLPYTPDWRWEGARDHSPWYPHMRLYRQVTPGGWQEPVAKLVADLTREFMYVSEKQSLAIN